MINSLATFLLVESEGVAFFKAFNSCHQVALQKQHTCLCPYSEYMSVSQHPGQYFDISNTLAKHLLFRKVQNGILIGMCLALKYLLNKCRFYDQSAEVQK